MGAADKRFVGRIRVVERTGGSLIYLTYTIASTFTQQFELRRFPFDQQKIRISTVYWNSPYDAVTSCDELGRVRAEWAASAEAS